MAVRLASFHAIKHVHWFVLLSAGPSHSTFALPPFAQKLGKRLSTRQLQSGTAAGSCSCFGGGVGGWGWLIRSFVYNLTVPIAVLIAVLYFVCIFQIACAADCFVFLFSSLWDCVSSSVPHCSDKTCTLWADGPLQLIFITVTKKHSFSSLLFLGPLLLLFFSLYF